MMGPAPDNLPFIFAAFAVVWAVFFGYAVYMSWRRQSLQRELRERRGGAGHSDSNGDDEAGAPPASGSRGDGDDGDDDGAAA